ncbi:MAG: ATP-binding protein [Blautia sp.]
MIISDRALMEDVLANAQIGLWVIEIDAGEAPRMYADKTMLKLLGLDHKPTPEECYQVWYTRIFPECYAKVNEAVEEIRCRHAGEVSYSWLHPKRGEMFIRCGGTLDADYKKGICLRGYHQDITKLAKLEQEKEGLAKFNETMLMSLKDLFYVIWLTDLETGKVQYIHRPEKYDVKTGEVLDAKEAVDAVRPFIHPEDQERFCEDLSMDKFLQMLEEGQEHFGGEYRRMMHDGCHWISVTAYITGCKGGPRSVLVAAQDVSDQREKENRSKEALMEAYDEAKRANQAKSEFLSKMSHDIRTPLNAILGMTTIAEMSMEDPECIKSCLEKIRTAGKSLKKLTDAILDMSKIESGKEELRMRAFSIEELLTDTLDMIEVRGSEKQLEISMDTSGIRHEEVVGDRTKLEKVFLNILSNAVKYTPEGGKVEIKAEEQPSLQQGCGRYQFFFRDTGIGMSREFQNKIFEPFARGNHHLVERTEGTGLGMVIAYNIVQLMKGELRVDSEEGKGSCFTVELNLTYADERQEPEKEANEKELLERSDFQGMKVLLAEDNALNAEIAETLLQMAGVECDTVSNGAEAVEAFSAHPAGYFEMIFMDIQMPVMDGYEAAERIRRLGRADAASVPIIAMTANAFQDDVQIATKAGMDAYIAKPIDIGRLVEVMGEMKRK